MKKMIVSLILCGFFLVGFSNLAIPKNCSKFPLMPWEFSCEMLESGCTVWPITVCICGFQWIPGTCDVYLYNCLGERVTQFTCGYIMP